jgi:hypothetical protein
VAGDGVFGKGLFIWNENAQPGREKAALPFCFFLPGI